MRYFHYGEPSLPKSMDSKPHQDVVLPRVNQQGETHTSPFSFMPRAQHQPQAGGETTHPASQTLSTRQDAPGPQGEPAAALHGRHTEDVARDAGTTVWAAAHVCRGFCWCLLITALLSDHVVFYHTVISCLRCSAEHPAVHTTESPRLKKLLGDKHNSRPPLRADSRHRDRPLGRPSCAWNSGTAWLGSTQ